MNHIYRSLYNKALGTWVAVPEIAKTHGKSAGGKSATFVLPAPRFAITALAGAFLLASGQVMAATGNKYPVPNGNGDNYCYYDTGSQSVICGDATTTIEDTYDSKPAKSVALGTSAKTTGESNVALGANSSASHTSGLAIGAKTKAHHNQTIAIGENATSMGEVDIMIGKSAGLGNTATSSTGRNIGIGEGAVSKAVKANNVIGIGTGAAAEINGSHIVAIGTDANKGVKTETSVAVGYKAMSPGTSSVAVGNAANSTGTTSIAVGNAASASGTNAVAVGKTAQAGASSVAVGSNTVATQAATIAVGPGAKTGNQRAIAIGENASGAATHTVAMGRAATSSGVSAIAIGGTQNEATKTQASGNYSIALGAESTLAKSENTVAIGRKTAAAGNNTVSLGAESGSIGVDADNAGSPANVNARTKAGKTSANGLVNMTNIGYKAGAGNINNNYGVNIGYEAGAGGYNSFYGEGVSIGNKAGGVDSTNTTVTAAMKAASQVQGGVAPDVIITGNTNTAISSRAGVNALGHDNVAIGKDAGGYGSGNSNIAIGRHAGRVSKLTTPGNENSRVIDADAFSTAKNTIAMGEWALGNADDAIAIGRGSQALAEKTIAIGVGNIVRGANSGAFGDPSIINGTDSYSVGNNNTIVTGTNNIFAFGNGITADVSNSVYLGSSARATSAAGKTRDADGSVPTAANAASTAGMGNVTQATVGSITYNGFVGTTPTGLITLGSSGAERRIQNLAAGEISATSTDAINGSQLFAVANQLATNAGTHYYSVNSNEQGADSNYNNDGATGSNALAAGRKAKAAGANSVAVGNEASAGHNLSVAIGHAAQTRGKHSLAIGARAKAGTAGSPAGADAGSWGTAIGYNAEASGTGSPLAIGTESKTVGGESPIAIGDWATVEGTGAIAIGGKAGGGHLPGRSTYAKGVRTVALGYLTQATEQDALALGANANASLGNAVALGAGSLTSTNATQEAQASVGNITYGATVGAPGAFAGAANVQAGDQVSVGSAGSERQIKHVAPGRIAADSTDAINGSQLFATQTVIGNVASTTATHLGGGATVGADGKISTPSYNVTDAAGNTVGTAANNVGAALVNLNTYVNSGFDVQGNGTTQGTVSPTEKINFINGTGTTAVVSQETNGVTNITFNVNAQNLAETARLPVVYTKADGTKVYLVNGQFYDNANGTGTPIPANQVIASMQNPDGTTSSPTTLANIKAGVNDTDAVNVSQLKGAANALGGGAGINLDGSFKAPSYVINKTDGTQYAPANNVGDALKNLNAEVVKPITFGGDNIAQNFDRTLGSEVFVKGGADPTKLTNNNIGVVSDGNGTLTVKLAENIDLGASGSVKMGNTTVNNAGVTIANAADPSKNVSLTGSGLNNGGNKITNVAAGTADTDAVNFGQLKNLRDTVNSGWNIGNGATAPVGAVTPGKRVDFVAGNTSTKVEVTQNATTGNSEVKISAAPSALQYTDTNMAAGGNTPVDPFTPTNQVTLVGAGGNTSNGVTINNVANGAVASDSKQAINGSQLHAHGSGVASIIGGNTQYNSTDGTYTNNNIGGTGKNNIHDAIASIKGTADQAAKPLKFKGDSGDTVVASPDDTVTIKGGETDSTKLSNGNNIGVDAKDGTDTLNIKLAKDLKDLKSAEFTDTAGNETKVDGNGVTIDPATPGKPDVSLTKDGLDNGGNKITHVADGEISANSTDAVNGSQLFALQQRPPVVNNITQVINNTTVSAGDNMQVIQQGDNYEVTIAPDIHLHSVTTGPVTMDAGGVSYDGHYYIDANGLNANGRVIREVAAGRIAPDSTDAVNGAQLHALGHQVDNRLGKLENALGDVDKRARAGIASAMASAGLPQAYRPGASMVAASAAHYDGQSAVAIGASTISDNGRWILKGTLNVNSKDAGASVGVGYQW